MAGSKKKAKRRAREVATPTSASTPVTRSQRPVLSEMVPVRFDPATLEQVRRHAADDDRSVSAWIRRAVDQELRREAR
jgi:hypothetical protein